jgi:YD repeat-containing protein
VVEEVLNGSVQRTYTYGVRRISQNSATATPTGQFYVYDGHGSVRALTDGTGAVIDTYEYDAFGNLVAGTGSTPNNNLYTGEHFDVDLGLYYLRARYRRRKPTPKDNDI